MATALPSTDWVIMLGGGSPGLDFCIGPTECALFANPPASPPPPPAPVTLGQGMQSSSCVTNPDWCKANQAMIPMCDMALLMSSAGAVYLPIYSLNTCCVYSGIILTDSNQKPERAHFL